MVGTVLSVIGMLVIIGCIVFWFVSLCQWDGEDECDPSDCDYCPFPCEKRKK